MAAECVDDGVSLKDAFEQGFLLHSQLEDDDEPSSSEVFQVMFIYFKGFKLDLICLYVDLCSLKFCRILLKVPLYSLIVISSSLNVYGTKKFPFSYFLLISLCGPYLRGLPVIPEHHGVFFITRDK